MIGSTHALHGSLYDCSHQKDSSGELDYIFKLLELKRIFEAGQEFILIIRGNVNPEAHTQLFDIYQTLIESHQLDRSLGNQLTREFSAFLSGLPQEKEEVRGLLSKFSCLQAKIVNRPALTEQLEQSERSEQKLVLYSFGYAQSPDTAHREEICRNIADLFNQLAFFKADVKQYVHLAANQPEMFRTSLQKLKTAVQKTLGEATSSLRLTVLRGINQAISPSRELSDQYRFIFNHLFKQEQYALFPQHLK